MAERPPRIGWSIGAATVIAAMFVAIRYWLATTPELSETYYDEAFTGLMGLAILRGIHPVFYWGQPYLGAVEGYIAAAGFWLFGPSTLVLRMSAVWVAVLWAWSVWSLARRIGGDGCGLLAGLYLAVPPIFLSYLQLSAHGQSESVTLGALTLAAGACLMDRRVGLRGRVAAWVTLGLAGGLGWWGSQLMGMFLIATALAIVGARSRTLREPGPYAALALFFLASLPFWVWNLRHEWATVWHLATWGGPLAPFPTRLAVMGGTLLASLQGAFWDGRAVRLPRVIELLGDILVWVVYLPAALVAAGRLWVWGRRLAQRARPWQEPLDLVVLAFWLTVAAHLETWFGSSGHLRYTAPFYATLPVLCAVVLLRVWRWRRVAAIALAGALFAYNALTLGFFVRQAESLPRRPVDAAIARLETLGVRACYADSRIAQVITFESRERIMCADYYGFRNFAFLQTVDAIDDPAAVAIVTHRVLQGPPPAGMAATLSLMGAQAARDEVGEYVIFHHIRPPDPPIRPIPAAEWSARASTNVAAAPLAFDRQVWTRWTAAKQGGEWFELDLGRAYPVAQVTLETGPFATDGPAGLRVETSRDGRAWETAVETADLISGAHWRKGHPRVDESGRVLARFPPRPARYVRLVQTGQDPRTLWTLGELFVYEVADAPWSPPSAAAQAYAEAERELARWMDDPGGPHPKRAPVTYEHRRAQVRWAHVFDAADRALDAAPEWEAGHHLYAMALDLSGWSEGFEQALARARADGAWREVLRWAALAEQRAPDFWRSGWAAARAEALEKLGRAAEAAAARAEVERFSASGPSAQAVRARFSGQLELLSVELPARARPGEPVRLAYAWRALHAMPSDYTAYVHLDGSGFRFDGDHVLGGAYGTSRWAAGEATQETLTLRVPPGAPSGSYRVKVGVWLPRNGKRLEVTEAERAHDRHAVTVGTLTVIR